MLLLWGKDVRETHLAQLSCLKRAKCQCSKNIASAAFSCITLQRKFHFPLQCCGWTSVDVCFCCCGSDCRQTLRCGSASSVQLYVTKFKHISFHAPLPHSMEWDFLNRPIMWCSPSLVPSAATNSAWLKKTVIQSHHLLKPLWTTVFHWNPWCKKKEEEKNIGTKTGCPNASCRGCMGCYNKNQQTQLCA